MTHKRGTTLRVGPVIAKPFASVTVAPPMSHSSSTPRLPVPAPLVALAGWLVPGSGYWLLGQRARSLTIGITVVVLFVVGVLLAGVRVVDAPALSATPAPQTTLERGRNPQPPEQPLGRRILDKPWFLGQVLTGPLGIIAAWGSARAAADPQTASIVSHARIAEIGTLYTAVAGMLNLLAIIDAAARAGEGKET